MGPTAKVDRINPPLALIDVGGNPHPTTVISLSNQRSISNKGTGKSHTAYVMMSGIPEQFHRRSGTIMSFRSDICPHHATTAVLFLDRGAARSRGDCKAQASRPAQTRESTATERS
jgi:hypothetical protein